MKHLLIFLFILTSTYLFSQEKSSRLEVFETKIKRLQKENKKDSTLIVTNIFEESKNLTLLEKKYLGYYQAINLKSFSKYENAIVILKKSSSLVTDQKDSKEINQLFNQLLSDLFFTIQDYDKANLFAKKALKNLVLNQQNHSVFIDLHSIIGFFEFKQTNYKASILEYQIAVNAAKKFNPCKVAEVKYKQAKIYSVLNQFKKAEQTIFESIKICDSCKETINKVNALRSYREILIENKQIKKANAVYDDLETYLNELKIDEQNIRIDSLEIAFKTRLKVQENLALKQINFQKEEILTKQKWTILAMIIGILLMLILLYKIFELSGKRKQNIKDLNRLNILNQKIFSVISHDFKGPITTLKIMLSKNNEIIENDSPIKNYINEINNQLGQSDEMLDSLLNWAKTELNSNSENNITINIRNAVTIACKDLFYKADEKKIFINNLINDDLDSNFNPSVLNIVLRNIINNAIKFSYENSSIAISFSKNCIIIRDYGKGIDPKKLEKLFTQNVIAGVGTHFESGFGIGLYLCNELMHKNKGSIVAINNADKGCTFTIILPN